MWSRDRDLGLKTVSRPKNAVLVSNVLGLGVIRCGLGLKGMVLGVWSRSFAFGLGLAPLVGTRVEYLLNAVDISGYLGISEITLNSCDDPPRTKRERTSLFASYQKRQENVEAQLTLTSGALMTII